MVDTVAAYKNNKEPPSLTECKTDFEIAYALLHPEADTKEVIIYLNTRVKEPM